MKWISVNEKLPPEPVRQVNTLDKIMAAIEAEELVEYLVIIDGAKKATTLVLACLAFFLNLINLCLQLVK